MTVRLSVSEAFAPEGRRVRQTLEAAGFDVEMVASSDRARLVLRSAEGRLGSVPLAATDVVMGMAEPRDALVGSTTVSVSLDGLGPGARVALEGPLRRELLGIHRPDAEVVEVADPAEALRLLDDGEVHGWIAPVPEVRAAGAAHRIGEVLEPTSWMTVAGRGALLLEADEGLPDALRDVLRGLDDPAARAALQAEAAVLRELGGGFRDRVGLMARPHGPLLRVRALVPAAEGRRLVRAELSGRLEDPEEVGRRTADQLVARGALDLLKAGAPS